MPYIFINRFKRLKTTKAPLTVIITLFFTMNACDKDAFYKNIPEATVVSSEISLTGNVKNFSLNSMKLFNPDGVISGGYAFGSAVKLDDGSLLAACTRYKPDGFDDFKQADIVTRNSKDDGHTWSNITLLQNNIGNINTLAPDLLRLDGQHILLFFAVKNNSQSCNILLKESFDNGKNWSVPKRVNHSEDGYYLMVNQRAIYNNGRIILPLAFVKNVATDVDKQVSFCFYSDDGGKTWQKSNYLRTEFALMEPAIASVTGNELLMSIRTKTGFLYFSRSTDNGANWKNIYKTNIPSPESPQALARISKSDTLVMIWNNSPYSLGHNNRTPLTICYSTDKGMTWKSPVNLESKNDYNYFYPTLFEDRGFLYITYGVRSTNDWAPILYYKKVSLGDLYK